MHINIIKEMRATQHLLPNSLGKVLEVGSLNKNGTAKDVYKKYDSYLGIDIRDGKDVDMVMNGHDLKNNFDENIFDTVICMNTLEHDDKFWLTLEGISYVLKSGGYMIFCVPYFYFPEHNFPDDYWRMSESAVKDIIFNGFEVLSERKVYVMIDRDITKYNHIVFAIGRKL